MKKHVAEAASWLSAERKRLGWSAGDMAERAADMASDFRWEGAVPTEADVEALEACGPELVPRWFKLLVYAVDRAAGGTTAGLAWLSERSHFFSAAPLQMSRPYLFADESRFINTLDSLEEEHRRALRAFVSNFANRQVYDTKERFARVLLEKFGVTATVLDERDQELVKRFQRLRAHQRDMVLDMMRQIVPD